MSRNRWFASANPQGIRNPSAALCCRVAQNRRGGTLNSKFAPPLCISPRRRSASAASKGIWQILGSRASQDTLQYDWCCGASLRPTRRFLLVANQQLRRGGQQKRHKQNGHHTLRQRRPTPAPREEQEGKTKRSRGLPTFWSWREHKVGCVLPYAVCCLYPTPVYLYRTLLFQRLPIDLAWIACEKQWPQQARLRRCSPRLSLQKPPPATRRDHRTGKGPPIRDWMPRSGQLSVELHR